MTNKRFKFICDDEKCFFKDWNKALYCYEVVDLLNSLSDENEQLRKEKECDKQVFTKKRLHALLQQTRKENEQLKEHQRTLEAKIVRLKDRVKTFEKHYSLKDIERYKKMDNCNCIDSRRLDV